MDTTNESIQHTPQVDRFWARVAKSPGDGCWIWTGPQGHGGYGQAYSRRPKSPTGAHRVAYELVVGLIPEGLTLDHLCRTPLCVRPDHLRPCTMRENLHAPGSRTPPAVNAAKTHCIHGHVLAGANLVPSRFGHRVCRACHTQRKKVYAARRVRPLVTRRAYRPKYGESHPLAKMNRVAVSVVHHLLQKGVSAVRLARAYGLSESAISRIRHGQSWAAVVPGDAQ